MSGTASHTSSAPAGASSSASTGPDLDVKIEASKRTPEAPKETP